MRLNKKLSSELDISQSKKRIAHLFWVDFSMFFFTFLLLCFFIGVNAKTIGTDTQFTSVHHLIVQNDQVLKTQAKAWGLRLNEYKHYLWLMQHTQNGHWYRALDPAEVLALNARDTDEMMQYAKIEARNVHMRVMRELAFNKLYAKAYAALYPHEKPIMSPMTQRLQGDLLHKGDRVWLFLGIHTPLGPFAYQHLIKVVQNTPNTVLDIYFVGKDVNQKTIQAWAISAGIPKALVNQQVTLNMGNDRFEEITQDKREGEKVELPYIGVIHHAHFQPITLSSAI